jgi:tetratricopeptide (TPR) repeat protein
MTVDIQTEVQQFLTKALQERGQRHYAEAIALCSQALEKSPKDSRLLLLQEKLIKLKKAFDLLAQGREALASEEALRTVEEALELRLLDEEVDVPMEIIQEERRELREALVISRKAVAQRLAQEAVQLVRTADGSHRRKAYLEARGKLERAAELDPENDSIQANLGEIRPWLRELEEADAFFQEGEAAFERKNYAQAIQHYEAALSRYEAKGVYDDNYRRAQARQREARDRLDVARAWAQGGEYLQTNPALAIKYYETALNIARAYEDLRQEAEYRLKQAESKLREAQSYDAAMRRGWEAMSEQDYEAAISHFQDALTFKPGDNQATLALERARQAKAQVEDLLSKGKQALAKQDLNAAKDFAHQVFDGHRKNKGARDFWQEVMLRSARTRLAQKDFEGARQEAREILNYFPGNEEAQALEKEAAAGQEVEALRQEGDQAYANKNYEQAVRSYAKAVETGGKYPWFPKEIRERLEEANKILEGQWRLAEARGKLLKAYEAKRWEEVVARCEELLKDPALEQEPGWQQEIEGRLREASQNLEKVKAWLEEAAHLENREEYGQARERYEAVLSLYPEHPMAKEGSQRTANLAKIKELYQQATSMNLVEFPDKALSLLEQAAEMAQAYPEWLSRITSLMEKAREAQAIKETFEQYRAQAEEARRTGHLQNAIYLWQKALEIRPDDQKTQEDLAQTQQALQELTRSLQEGKEALVRAQTAYEAERDEEVEAALNQAKDSFSAALNIAPGNNEAQAGLKKVEDLRRLLDWALQVATMRHQRNYDGALRLLEEVLKERPDPRLERLQKVCAQEWEQERQARLAKLRQQAEDAWNRMEYEVARGLYRQIVDMDAGDALARGRLNQLDREAERRDKVRRLIYEGDSFLKAGDQADYGRAVDSYLQAWNLLLAEGDVDKEVETKLRSAWALWQTVDAATPSEEVDKTQKEAIKMLNEVEEQWLRERRGRETGLLLEVARKLFEAQRRKVAFGRVQSAIQAEEYEKAVQAAWAELQKDPSDPKWQKAYEDARDRLRTFQKGRAVKRINWGEEALRLGDYEKAIAYFEEAAALDYLPDETKDEALRLKGEAERLKSIAEKVMEALSEAREAFNAGDYRTAREKLARAEAIQEAERQLAILTAKIEGAQAQGRSLDPVMEITVSAIKAFLIPAKAFLEEIAQAEQRKREEEVKKHLNDARAKLARAQKEEDFADAIEIINQTLAINPDHSDARSLLEQARAAREDFMARVNMKSRGLQALKDQRWADAVALLEEAYKLDRTDAEVVEALWLAREKYKEQQEVEKLLADARAAFQIENYEEAAKLLSQLLGKYPDHQEAKGLFAEVRAQLKKQQAEAEAERRKREAELRERQRIEREIRRLRAQGKIALEQREYATAIRCFQEALAKNPDDEETMVLLSQAEARQRQVEEAQPYVVRARRALENGNYIEAFRQSQQALEKDPGNPEAASIKQQAELLIALHRALDDRNYSQARDYLNQLQNLGVSPELLSELKRNIDEGENYLRKLRDKVEEARRILESYRTRRLLQSDDLTQINQAWAYLEEYRREMPTLPSDVEEVWNRVRGCKDNLERVVRLVEQAKAYLNAQSPDQASKTLDEALAIEPRYAEAQELAETSRLLTQAREALEHRDFDQALAICNRILTYTPNQPQALQLQEEIKAKKEKALEAEKYLALVRKYLKDSPTQEVAEEMQQNLELAQKCDPDHPDLPRLGAEVGDFRRRVERLQRWMKQAEVALQNRAYDEVIGLCEDILQEDPQNKIAQGWKTQAEKGRAFENSMAEARRLRGSRKWAEARQKALIALSNAQTDEEEKAVYAFIREAEEEERQQAALERLSEAWQAIEACDDAQAGQIIQEVLQKIPGHPEAQRLQNLLNHLQQALVALESKEFVRSLNLLHQAQELAPGSQRVASLLEQVRTAAGVSEQIRQAREYLASRQYTAAMEFTRKLQTLDPSHPEVMRLVADLLTRLRTEAENARAAENYLDALAFCDQALLLAPGDELTQQLRKAIAEEIENRVAVAISQAQAALKGDDLAGARIAIAQGLRLVPNHPALRKLEDDLKNREQNRETANKLVAQGREMLAVRDYAKAKEFFGEAARTDTRHPTAQIWLQFTTWIEEGIQLQARQEFEEAASRFNQAANLEWPGDIPPEVAEAKLRYQKVLESASRYKQAQELKTKADAEMAAGNYEEALRLYKEAERLMALEAAAEADQK